MISRVKSTCRTVQAPDQVSREEVLWTAAHRPRPAMDAGLREQLGELDRLPAVVQPTPERRGYGE